MNVLKTGIKSVAEHAFAEPGLPPVQMVLSSKAMTFECVPALGHSPAQFVLRVFEGPGGVVEPFDLMHCGVFWNGSAFCAPIMAMVCLYVGKCVVLLSHEPCLYLPPKCERQLIVG